jgi:UDP-4-amino-4-deoxy-L-arabinose formyltransferase/UDP-glucuronic acid dehydrogenase (UDP-4-keto-hexauronic acid decarboxylating)
MEKAKMGISAVFSHQDDPAENCWFGSVEAWARQRGIPVHCPPDVNEPQWVGRIAALRPDMIFSFYYRRMLSENILALPPLGAYNLHGSYLPAYRGRCPVNWVLVNGEARTGVTLHHMIKTADAGDIVGQRSVAIGPGDTALILYGKLCDAAGGLLDEILPLMITGKASRTPQDLSQGSYYGGRTPADGRIDWRWTAKRIHNLIRAVTEPYPGAFGFLPGEEKLLIWRASPCRGTMAAKRDAPGKVLLVDQRVMVQTGEGKVELLDVEAQGRRMAGDALLAYFRDKEGMILT